MPPQPCCIRISISAPCQTSTVEGPGGLLWPLEGPVCVQGDGRNQGNVRERDRNPGEHPDCSRQQLLKYQNPNGAAFWPRGRGGFLLERIWVQWSRGSWFTDGRDKGSTCHPSVQDPGFPEGAAHRGEADQRHQGDPGGHQERGPAERLLRVARWARAWLA